MRNHAEGDRIRFTDRSGCFRLPWAWSMMELRPGAPWKAPVNIVVIAINQHLFIRCKYHRKRYVDNIEYSSQKIIYKPVSQKCILTTSYSVKTGDPQSKENCGSSHQIFFSELLTPTSLNQNLLTKFNLVIIRKLFDVFWDINNIKKCTIIRYNNNV